MNNNAKKLFNSYSGNSQELSQLCLSITDCPHSTPKWTDSGKLVVRSANIKNGTINFKQPSFTDPVSFLERNRRATPESGDLVITREAPMGEIGIIPDGVECCLGQRVVLLKPNKQKVSSKYLLYAILSEFVQKQIKGNDRTGSTVSNLNIPHLEELKIPLLPFQEKIAKTLSALDSKIELNNRINAELEAMAKTLYDYWFVQFDYPDQNGKPYKSSGGKMVYNETLKREIPEGWEVWTLQDLVDVVKGNVLPSNIDPNTPYVGLEHIGRKTIVLADWSTSNVANSNKTAFKKHDILFGKIRPYFHKVAVALFDGITSTDTILLRPKKSHYFGIALETVFTEKFIETATQSSTGSKMPRADWNILQNYAIPLPNTDLLNVYQPIFDSFLKKIESSVIENRKLGELKDWLLPMLMNGQVTVK